MTDIKDTTLRGVNLLRNPWFNKSSAFTEKERDELGLRGLLPPRVSTFDEQVTRLKGIIDTYEKPINKYIVLEGAHNSDECLYFELLVRYIDQFLPIVCGPATFSVMPAVFMFPVKTKAVFVSWSPTFRTKMSTSLSSRTVSAFSV
mgnify:CR=1 FL=1